MLSAFGVEHGPISKAEGKKKAKRSLVLVNPNDPDARLPRVAGNVVPAATVRAFDNSRQRKPEAAALNIGSKVAGSTVGLAAGGALATVAAAKSPALRRSSKVLGRTISAAQKKGAAQYAGATAGGAVGSTIGSEWSSRHIRRSKRYKYKERGL